MQNATCQNLYFQCANTPNIQHKMGLDTSLQILRISYFMSRLLQRQ